MTTHDQRDEDELKEYLLGKSKLSKTLQQLAKEEPSALIDDAIRAAARREAQSGPRHITNPFGQHWTVPSALAAMLLLSVGLVVFMSDETGTNQIGDDVLEEYSVGRDAAQPAARQDKKTSSSPLESAAPVSGGRAGKTESGEKILRTKSYSSEAESIKPAKKSKARKRLLMPRSVEDTDSGFRVKPAPEIEAQDGIHPKQKVEKMMPETGLADSLLSAEEWLKQIQKLRGLGKTAEADASLEKFRKAYPDYPVPK